MSTLSIFISSCIFGYFMYKLVFSKKYGILERSNKSNYYEFLLAEQEAKRESQKFFNEIHNLEVEHQMRMDEFEDRKEYTDALMEHHNKAWEWRKDKVQSMSVEEKLEWIPKWVGYLVEYAYDDKNEYEKMFLYLNFERFIAVNMDPQLFFCPPIRLRRGYITYI